MSWSATSSNPFFGLNADIYSPERVIELFQPTPALARVLQEENQVIYGGPGTGKSILFRSLALATVVRRPAAAEPRVIGVYVNCLRELAFLNSVLESAEGVRARVLNSVDKAQRFNRHYICLTLAWCFCRELQDAAPFIDSWSPNLVSTIRRVERLFGLSESTSLDSLVQRVDEMRSELQAHVADQTMLSDTVQSRCVVQDVRATCEYLCRAVRASLKSGPAPEWPIYILLDQYDQLDAAVQRSLNALLLRGGHFFSKVAIRPYGLETMDTDGLGSIGGGLRGELVEPVQSTEQYESVLTRVASRMAGGLAVRKLLDSSTQDARAPRRPRTVSYAAFPSFSRLSSGSVRNFLELCSLAVEAANGEGRDWRSQGFLDSHLDAAAVSLARRELDRMAAAKRVSGQAVQRLVEGLCKRLKANNNRAPEDVEFEIRSEELVTALGPGVLDVLKKAFREGALRFASESDASLERVPDRFEVNRVFLPHWGLQV